MPSSPPHVRSRPRTTPEEPPETLISREILTFLLSHPEGAAAAEVTKAAVTASMQPEWSSPVSM